MNHAWGDDRILTHLKEGRDLYAAIINGQKVPFPPPRFISCWISEVCNLDCTYCFFSETNHDKSHLYIDREVFLRWLQEAKDSGAEALEFSGGGEPTLHPEFQRIYQTAHAMGYALGLITHACNDMPVLDMAGKFKYVRCGLDAATAETHDAIKRNKRKDYWFHKAIENIKELVRIREAKSGMDFTVGIKVVLNSVNFHELEAMIQLARDLRVNYIQIKREHSSDNDLGPEQMSMARGILRRETGILAGNGGGGVTRVLGTVDHARATAKCFMSPIHTVVTATGKVLQCCFFEERPIGTIFQTFRDVWGSTEHRAVIERTTVQECDKLDCRWNSYNAKMKEIIEDPLAQASFI